MIILQNNIVGDLNKTNLMIKNFHNLFSVPNILNKS